MRILTRITLLLLTISAAVALRAQNSPPHVIAGGVWFLTGDTNGYSNTVIIEMRDYLIIVDANYPGRAHELLNIYQATFTRSLCDMSSTPMRTAIMRTATRCGQPRALRRWPSRA